MQTYRLRDTRIAVIESRLAGLPPDDVTRRPALERERQRLQVSGWQVSDAAFRAIGPNWLTSFSDAASLLAALQGDPANDAPLITEEQAQRIIAIPPDPLRQSPKAYQDLVAKEVDDDRAIVDSLLQSAHLAWFSADAQYRKHPLDDVVITLPVRLETLFDPPDPQRERDPDAWLLSIRVIPDEASVIRDFSYLGPDERAPLEAFWNRVRQDGDLDPTWLEGDLAGVAWDTFAAQVGAERAAWLIANIQMLVEDDRIVIDPDVSLPTEPQPNWVRGLPPQMQIVADVREATGSLTQVTIGRLPIDESDVIDDELLSLPLPRTSQDLEGAWWTSFECAIEVGLGGIFALPPGVTPQSITTLYVVGVGDADPGVHFQRQADCGELSIVPLGTATNAVKDDPAAPRPPTPDWRAIARDRLKTRLSGGASSLGDTGQQLERLLGGSSVPFPLFPGHDAPNDCADSQLMAQALWPALWGHWLRDVWSLDWHAYEVGGWMMDNLFPEGPMMPIRIGDQPYGLLPAISLIEWAPDWNQNPEDTTRNEHLEVMRQALIELRRHMADTALSQGNVVAGDAADFMRILGNPVSSRRYVRRTFVPAALPLLPQGPDPSTLAAAEEAAVKAYSVVTDLFGVKPAAPYVSAGYWAPNRLPLVRPRRLLEKYREREGLSLASLPRFLCRLFALYTGQIDQLSIDELFDRSIYVDDEGEWRLSALPDSLLIRLLVYSAQLSTFWRQTAFETPAETDVLTRHEEAAMRLAEYLDRAEWQREIEDEVPNPPAYTLKIPPPALTAMERAFRATLDAAAHRIDPFTTGFSWDRLRRTDGSDRRNFRLGVYGWVDGPFLGEPGPTAAGLLHTPSYAQTLAALILRDRFLSSTAADLRSESNANPWQMDITSNRTRLAIEIAEEVRMGFHIYEVVGRQVEQVIGKPQAIRALRQLPECAMRVERRDPNEVVNGLAALDRLLNGTPAFPMPNGELVQLTDDQLGMLHELQDALDVYADLLVADGIMQLTQRQIDQAAASMDAAAGMGMPSKLQFVQTPPSGYQLSTMVLSALPFEPLSTADPLAVHPAALADPSVATWAEAFFAGDWQWVARNAEDGSVLGTKTLSALGLKPLDALTVSPDLVTELVRRTLDLPDADIEFPAQWRQMQEAVATLGSRPLLAADLGIPHEQRGAFDDAVWRELRDRYVALRSAAQVLVSTVGAADTDQDRAALLRQSLSWGILPASTPQDRDGLLALLLGTPLPPGASDATRLCQAARDMLTVRINASPLSPSELPLEGVESPPMPAGIAEMANLVATFAAPNARLAVLARWPVADLKRLTQLELDEPEADLDAQWLTVVAATRANLARLEAMQLEIDPLFVAWTSSPGDPWRVQPGRIIDRNRTIRAGQSVGALDLTPMTVAYGAENAWERESVAIGVIDAFGEAIPMAERNTFAAFGFNAPAARPPQAILLAVPPQPRVLLDDARLLQIVRETRLSALARATHVEALGPLQAVMPTSWLIASGPLAARLEPWPVRELGVS
jgi:hypothetical protein